MSMLLFFFGAGEEGIIFTAKVDERVCIFLQQYFVYYIYIMLFRRDRGYKVRTPRWQCDCGVWAERVPPVNEFVRITRSTRHKSRTSVCGRLIKKLFLGKIL